MLFQILRVFMLIYIQDTEHKGYRSVILPSVLRTTSKVVLGVILWETGFKKYIKK